MTMRGPGAFLGMFGLGTVAAWPDTMLFGIGGINEVYVATWDGEVIDTVFYALLSPRCTLIATTATTGTGSQGKTRDPSQEIVAC